MILIADWLSLYMGVGSVFSIPSSSITDLLIYFMFFAAVTAAISSASAELNAVIDCALDWYSMAPPQCISAYPVVERRFVGLFLYAASTKHTNLVSVVSVRYCGKLWLLLGISGIRVVGDSFCISFQWNMNPHSLVVRKYFAIHLRQW